MRYLLGRGLLKKPGPQNLGSVGNKSAIQPKRKRLEKIFASKESGKVNQSCQGFSLGSALSITAAEQLLLSF